MPKMVNSKMRKVFMDKGRRLHSNPETIARTTVSQPVIESRSGR